MNKLEAQKMLEDIGSPKAFKELRELAALIPEAQTLAEETAVEVRRLERRLEEEDILLQARALDEVPKDKMNIEEARTKRAAWVVQQQHIVQAIVSLRGDLAHARESQRRAKEHEAKLQRLWGYYSRFCENRSAVIEFLANQIREEEKGAA